MSQELEAETAITTYPLLDEITLDQVLAEPRKITGAMEEIGEVAVIQKIMLQIQESIIWTNWTMIHRGYYLYWVKEHGLWRTDPDGVQYKDFPEWCTHYKPIKDLMDLVTIQEAIYLYETAVRLKECQIPLTSLLRADVSVPKLRKIQQTVRVYVESLQDVATNSHYQPGEKETIAQRQREETIMQLTAISQTSTPEIQAIQNANTAPADEMRTLPLHFQAGRVVGGKLYFTVMLPCTEEALYALKHRKISTTFQMGSHSDPVACEELIEQLKAQRLLPKNQDIHLHFGEE